MTAALANAPKVPAAPTRLFLDVERSVTRPRLARPARRAGDGARARDRAARRGAGTAGARARRPRRRVDDVEAYLDPTVRRLMPDPHTVTAMEAAARPHRRRDDARRAASRSSATTTSMARPPRRCWRASCARSGREPIDPHSGPHLRRLRPERRARSARSRRSGATLLITVDCGTTSLEPLAEARKLGLDVVVIDHHQADEQLPDALVVNPNRLDDLSGLGHLAAVGLVFITIVAVNRVLRTRGFWTDARPEPDLLGCARYRRARHRRRRGAAARASTAPSSPRG